MRPTLVLSVLSVLLAVALAQTTTTTGSTTFPPPSFGDRQQYVQCAFDQTNYRSQVTNWYLRTTTTRNVYEVTEEYREVVGPCNSNLGVYLLQNSGFRLNLTSTNSADQTTKLYNGQLTIYLSYITAFRDVEQNNLRNYCNSKGCCQTLIGKGHRIDYSKCLYAVCNGSPVQYLQLQWQDANSFVISSTPGCGAASAAGAFETVAYTRVAKEHAPVAVGAASAVVPSMVLAVLALVAAVLF